MHAEHWSLAFLVCRWYQPVPTRLHQSKIFFPYPGRFLVRGEAPHHFFSSKMFKFTCKNRNRLNTMKNHASDFSDFYFSSYGHFLVIFWRQHFNFRWIFSNNWKNKYRRIFFILFGTFPIIHKNWIKTEGGSAYP